MPTTYRLDAESIIYADAPPPLTAAEVDAAQARAARRRLAPTPGPSCRPPVVDLWTRVRRMPVHLVDPAATLPDPLAELRDRSRHVGHVAPLAADHPDAILAREGRTDANGYRYEGGTAVPRPGMPGHYVARYAVHPLRIGGRLTTIGNGTLGDTSEGAAEYRRRNRAAIAARDYVASARRVHATLAETLTARVLPRAYPADGPPRSHFAHLDAPGRPDRYRRPSVLVMVADLSREMAHAGDAGHVASKIARQERRGARVLVERPREAARAKAKRDAMTPDERKAAAKAAAARRAARLAAMTPDERTAWMAQQAAKARARRAAKAATEGGK